MAKKYLQVHLPIGRYIYGSLYELEADKNGVKKYNVTLAIPKQSEVDWKQTAWGKQIDEFAKVVFVNNESLIPTFSWKIHDGDRTTPNEGGSIPSKLPGWAGNWILRSSSMAPIKILTADGSRVIPEEGVVKCGDYLECIAIFSRNNPPKDGSLGKPGLYCHISHAAFSARGEEIQRSPMVDVSNEKFGTQALPAGASPVTDVQGSPIGVSTQRGAPTDLPAPHTSILGAPPAPPIVPPAKHMTALATTTYDEYIKAKWTDELLVQHGLMTYE